MLLQQQLSADETAGPNSQPLHVRLAKLILDLEANTPSKHKSNKNGWQSGTDLFETDHEAVRELRNRTYAAAYSYMMSLPSSFVSQDRMGRLEMHIHAAWACVSRMFASNNPHVHPQSTLSGVYYVDPGPPPGSRLYFRDPRPSIGFNSRDHALQPKAGLLVMFPSWLEHYVEPLPVTQGDTPRLAIAFNIRVQQRFDSARGEVELSIPEWHL
jgi:uncharacterized protein (TIGR02466 family)